MRHGMITKAIEFAIAAHGEQKRKYTFEPYFTHPMAVARYVASHVRDFTQEMVVAALLHDVVEDTPHTLDEIRDEFGDTVATYVHYLTDVSTHADGNRATRKRLDREHIAKAPVEAKTIKLADLIDNTSSIVAHDPKFAKVYLAEKVLLLEVLGEGDAGLMATAMGQVLAHKAS